MPSNKELHSERSVPRPAKTDFVELLRATAKTLDIEIKAWGQDIANLRYPDDKKGANG